MLDEIVATPIRDSSSQEYNYTVVTNRATIVETIDQLRTDGHRQIALVTLTLFYKMKDEKTEQARIRQVERANQGAVYLLQNIRRLVRRTDRVFLYNQTLYFVLLGANFQGAAIVEERLWEAILWRMHNMAEQEISRPFKITSGHASYPEPHAYLDELLDAADMPGKSFSERAPRLPGRGTRQEAAAVRGGSEELPQMARKLGIPYLSLLPDQLPQRVLQLINSRLAHELHCYPIGRDRNVLTVAMLNPQDHGALERLHKETGLRIFPVLTHPEALESALKLLN